MPENDSSPFTITPTHLRACLVTLVHGPYADADTAVVGGLAAEAVRYLNHAFPRAGSPTWPRSRTWRPTWRPSPTDCPSCWARWVTG
jgi:hypothetical protein